MKEKFVSWTNILDRVCEINNNSPRSIGSQLMDPNQHLRNLVPRPDLNGLLAGTPKSPVKPIIKELLTKASVSLLLIY